MPVIGRHRHRYVVMTAAHRARLRGQHRVGAALAAVATGRRVVDETRSGNSVLARMLLTGLALAVVLTGVTTFVGPVPSTAAAELPICLPGQEAATQAGAGTPAPLGTLEGLPAEAADGGVYAGIALDGKQVEMAATVIAVGKQMGITRRGIEIGVAVATQQSSLRPEAVNGEWLGLFQQNPITYTQYRRTEPGGAAWMFYDQLLKQVPGLRHRPATEPRDRRGRAEDHHRGAVRRVRRDGRRHRRRAARRGPAAAGRRHLRAGAGDAGGHRIGLRSGQHRLGRGLLQRHCDDGGADPRVHPGGGRGLHGRLVPEEPQAHDARPARRRSTAPPTRAVRTRTRRP